MKKNKVKLNALKVDSFKTSTSQVIRGGAVVDSWQGHSMCEGCHISH